MPTQNIAPATTAPASSTVGEPAVVGGAEPRPGADGWPWDELEALDLGIPAGYLDTFRTASNRIWKQYEGGPNWLALMQAIGGAFDDAEKATRALASRGGLALRHAIGARLDQWGVLLKVPRGGFDDGEYRVVLLARIRALFGSGTIPQILTIVDHLLPGDAPDFELRYPAGWRLVYGALSASEFAILCVALFGVAAAGVKAEAFTGDEGATAGFDYPTSPVPNLGAYGYASGTSLAYGDFSLYGYGILLGVSC